MDERTTPYNDSETLVAEYLNKLTGIGAGDDPIGFIIASHAMLGLKIKDLSSKVLDMEKIIALVERMLETNPSDHQTMDELKTLIGQYRSSLGKISMVSITDDASHREALKRLDILMERLNKDGSELDQLVDSIMEYERLNFPIDPPSLDDWQIFDFEMLVTRKD